MTADGFSAPMLESKVGLKQAQVDLFDFVEFWRVRRKLVSF